MVYSQLQATVNTSIRISDFLERYEAVRHGGLTEKERTFCTKIMSLPFGEGVARIKVYVRINKNVSLYRVTHQVGPRFPTSC